MPVASALAARKSRSRPRGLTNARRSEIIQAAIKVFSRHGFEAARAEDIAHAANIAKGTLYLYFPSKEAIYSAAIAYAVAELQVLAAERIGAATGFREKLATAITVRLRFWTEYQSLYRLLLTLGREPHHRRQTNTLLRSGQAHFLALFQEGVSEKLLREQNYGPLAWAVLDMIRGATERRMDRCSTSTVEEDTEAITAMVLRASGLSQS